MSGISQVRRVLLLLLLGNVLLFGCGSETEPKEYSLVEDEEAEDDSELARLRRLQMVRVIGWKGDATNGYNDGPYEIELPVDCSGSVECSEEDRFSDLTTVVRNNCLLAVDYDSQASCQSDACKVEVCEVRADMCVAHQLAEIAAPRTSPMRLEDAITGVMLEIPAQNTSTRSELYVKSAQWGRKAASRAADNIETAVTFEGGFIGPASSCSDTGFTDAQLERLTSTLVEGYRLAEESSRQGAESIVSFAEAQRSKATSLTDAVGQEYSSILLSRSVAAAVYGGGYNLLAKSLFGQWPLPEELQNGFCTSPELTGDAKHALDVLRQAGLDPADIENDDLPIDTLISDEIEPRLESLWGADIANNGGLLKVLGLPVDAFKDARRYIDEEIEAFARSFTRLEPIPEMTDTYRYAGTSTAPTQPPAAYYATLMRGTGAYRFEYSGTDGLLAAFTEPNGYIGFQIDGAPSLSILHDWVLSEAAVLLKNGEGLPAAVRDQLAVLTSNARQTRNGVVIARHPVSLSPRVLMLGYDADVEDIRIVAGEDGLRCAVEGNIEGAACDMPSKTWRVLDKRLETPTLPEYSSDEVGMFVASTGGASVGTGERVYVVRRRDPTSKAIPGNYEVLTGFAVPPEENCTDCQEFWYTPVTPELDQRIADVLAPSPKWCTRPAVSCAGEHFDARLPLEDELTDDGDGVESSWRHYLALAEQAAKEADLLGEQYVNARLEFDRREEEVSLRLESQRARAESILEELQEICGTAIDPGKLLDKLGGDLSGMNAVSCDDQTPCSKDTQTCMAGTCVQDIAQLAQSLSGDPDFARLAECIGSSDTVEYMAIGNKSVCIWRDTNNPNIICEGADRLHPCPVVATGAGCEADLGYDASDPVFSETEVKLIEETLDFYDVKPPVRTETQCDALRRVRLDRWYDRVTSETLEMEERIVNSDVFAPANLKRAAERIKWVARYGSFSEIWVDGAQRYVTGYPFSGPVGEGGGWPCNRSSVNCASDDYGTNLFCEVADCTVVTEPGYCIGDSTQCAAPGRAEINDRMARAVAAAGVMTGVPIKMTHFGRYAQSGGVPSSTGNYYADGAEYIKQIESSDPPTFVYRYMPTGTWSPAEEAYVINAAQAIPTYVTADDSKNWIGFAERESEPSGTAEWFMRGKSRSTSTALSEARFGERGAFPDFHSDRGESRPITVRLGDAGHELELDRFSPFHDALELLCDVGVGNGTDCAGPPPPVTTVEDLANASAYIECIADSIERRAGTSFLTDIPKRARSVLKEAAYDGAFPAVGGAYGQAISQIRSGLIEIAEVAPLISEETRQMGFDIDQIRLSLQLTRNERSAARTQFLSTVADRVAQCANQGSSLLDNVTNGFGAKTAITCANSIAQISFASQLNSLAQENAALKERLEFSDLSSRISARSTALQGYATRIADAYEQVQIALSQFESLRLRAERTIARALWASSFQAQNEGAITGALLSRYHTTHERYSEARRNAVRMAFFAKRAIELRLGVRLSTLTEELPLVEAPARWESSVCESSGIDYERISESTEDNVTTYADAFIGQYVNKLRNVVESYRLVNNFHEGTDTAVVSLRDDIHNVRTSCAREVNNLLKRSGDLAYFAEHQGVEGGEAGWGRVGCGTSTNADGEEQFLADCVRAEPAGRVPHGGTSTEWPAPQAFDLVHGDDGDTTCTDCGHTGAAAIAQTVRLGAGRYRLSWYETHTELGPGVEALTGCTEGELQWDCTNADEVQVVTGTSGQEILNDSIWARKWLQFELAEPAPIVVTVAHPDPSAGQFSVGGLMLEDVSRLYQSSTFDSVPAQYAETDENGEHILPVCEDTDGEVFRADKWRYDCVNLCSDGFGDCSEERATPHCFWETSFHVTQRAIQEGRMFTASGFARGNFNYRIESLALNFVGAGVRDCADAELPSTCYSAGYIPYSVYHGGPYFVRNHRGDDFRAELFAGRIEHARGLATERYISNPISSSDRELLDPYTRLEFQGRPLDGSFVVRVWDEEGVEFDAIQDVQAIVKYRYWTRFD